jgi:hypothetical protein
MQAVKVFCHSGYTYPQEPRRFIWQGTQYEITGVISESRSPQTREFLVKCGEEFIFKLYYQEETDSWFIEEQ